MSDRPRRKKPATKRGEASSSQAPTRSQPSPPSSEATPAIPMRPPWPKLEGKKIRINRDWNEERKKEFETPEYINRPVSDDWDDYDSLLYNGWLDVEIKATRFADSFAMRSLGIQEQVTQILEIIGLGTICTKQYHLYPDLVRQFMASVRVDYVNERVKNAQEGTLSFFIKGVRYSITLRDLCEVYGFEPDNTGVGLPSQSLDAQDFWSFFGLGTYETKTSTQADIRHPVLRYVVRILANTILCKMEPNKMRLAELTLLYFALGAICHPNAPEPFDTNVNMGAVFADHLVSLKTKPYTGTGKKVECIGSLLTPIFEHLGISVAASSVVTKRSLMDITYMQNANWMKPGLMWCYRDATGSHMVQLPRPELTTLTGEPGSLLFQPPAELVKPVLSSRRLRGSSSAAASTAENEPVTTPFPELPPYPAEPMDTEDYRKFMYNLIASLWGAVSRLSQSCVRPTSRSRRRRRSPSSSAEEDHD